MSGWRPTCHSLKISKLPCRQLKTITFRIPGAAGRKELEVPKSDPLSTWPIIQSIIPSEEGRDASRTTIEEHRVLDAFSALKGSFLPLPKPQIRPSPFEYFTLVNEDRSYLTQPRLSVTKLLTAGWCELQSFYDVFAGLREIKSSRLATGVKHHEKLERKAHPKLDSELVDLQIEQASEGHTEEKKKLLFETKMAHQLASQWSEKVVTRLLQMASTGMLREIQVHGFLDLHSGSLAENLQEIPGLVLVNGVIDIVSVDTFNHEDPEPLYEHDEADPTTRKLESMQLPQKILDLSKEIPKAKEHFTELSKDHFLHVGDIKTRRVNSIPAQQSVLLSARNQCFFYSQFINTLSRDPCFGYSSWIENGIRRNVDPDTPISAGYAAELLIQQFSTLSLDFLRLAEGEPIGFDAFDHHCPTPPTEHYSLSDFASKEQFHGMLAELYGLDSPLLQLDISPLFKNWSKPPTLRYFAARAGQAFNILEAFLPGSVSVEYHNIRANSLVLRIHYAYDEGAFKKVVQDSATFWNGSREPIGTESKSRCSYCKFQNRCPVKNDAGPEKIAQRLSQLYD